MGSEGTELGGGKTKGVVVAAVARDGGRASQSRAFVSSAQGHGPVGIDWRCYISAGT